MKITKLRLKNIKCFKELEISFEEEDVIKNWSLIVADNGQGKTTILRSLALALCDKEGASSLLSELYGGFVRNGETTGEISVTLKDKSSKKKESTITTTITLNSETNTETIEQVIEPKDSSANVRKNIFATAYGAGRSVAGDKSYEDYALVDALYSLFSYEARLQNAELIARRIHSPGSDTSWEKCQVLLKKVLMLKENDKILLEKKGLYIESEQWGKILFNALSDGYQSLTSVILDLLGWKLISEDDFDLESFSGIVIIDEIEQHLHPRWQRDIIKILSLQFPNLQFICSTHTSICALGLNDLTCLSQLVRAKYVNSHSEIETFDLREDFKAYRVDQILTSDIFDLSSARSQNIESKLDEHANIYLKEEKSRTDEEKEKLEKLKTELKGLPMWDTQEDKLERKK